MSKIGDYLKDTRSEMKHVIWPSRMQTIYYTIIVIVVSVLVAYYLGFFDYLFSLLLQRVLGV